MRSTSFVFRDGQQSAQEVARLAVLQKPVPKNPELSRRVQIKRISERFGFLIDGHPVELGDIVSTTEITARDLIARGKAERVE